MVFLAHVKKQDQVGVSLKGVSVIVDEVTSPAAKVVKKVLFETPHGGKNDPYPLVLQNITCEFAPGEVTLVLAPDGGGETYLMQVLANPNDPLYHVTGKLLFNGAYACSSLAAALKDDTLQGGPCIGAIVQQAVIAHEGDKGSVAVADELLELLHLTDQKFNALGPADDSDEADKATHLRKRVKVAQALAARPSVLLVHEPLVDATPGETDSMMRMLTKLAHGGRTVIIGSEEGMSEEAYQQVDKVLLLSRGRMMYWGKASEAYNWFASQGYQKPADTSVPDFLVNLADGAATDDPEQGAFKRAESVEMAAAYLREYPQGYQGGEIPAMTDDEEDEAQDAGKGHANGKVAAGRPAAALFVET